MDRDRISHRRNQAGRSRQVRANTSIRPLASQFQSVLAKTIPLPEGLSPKHLHARTRTGRCNDLGVEIRWVSDLQSIDAHLCRSSHLRVEHHERLSTRTYLLPPQWRRCRDPSSRPRCGQTLPLIKGCRSNRFLSPDDLERYLRCFRNSRYWPATRPTTERRHRRRSSSDRLYFLGRWDLHQSGYL